MNKLLSIRTLPLICLFYVFLISESCQLDKFEEKRTDLEKSAQSANDSAVAFIEEMQKEIQIEDIEKETEKDLLKNIPISIQKVLSDKPFAEEYALSNWLTPNYQKVDFEGDGKPEYIVLIINKNNQKRGYAIIENDNFIIHGAGVKFGAGGDDYNWLEYWEVIREETFEVTIVEDGEIIGTREVKNPSEALLVKELEGAGGYVIKDGKYKWLQLE